MSQSHLQVLTDLNVLPDIVNWFKQFRQSSLPTQTWLQANTALIEGFTNAVRHAHEDLSMEVPIDITVNISPDSFMLEIWDSGAPYDFDTALAQLKQLINAPDFDPLEREEHWGEVIFINLIDKYGWQIKYLREMDSRNCLRAQCSLDFQSA